MSALHVSLQAAQRSTSAVQQQDLLATSLRVCHALPRRLVILIRLQQAVLVAPVVS